MLNLENEKKKGCRSFLKYIYSNYALENAFDLTDDLLTNDKVKHTMRNKLARLFHPDKVVNESDTVK